MGENSNIIERLDSFIAQYMTQDEFLVFTLFLLILMVVSMFVYVVYAVVKNERSAKKLRNNLKNGDIVRVHGIPRDCTVEEVNGKEVIVKIKVPLDYIYTTT
jgi:preprotein translocase subunit YajC